MRFLLPLFALALIASASEPRPMLAIWPFPSKKGTVQAAATPAPDTQRKLDDRINHPNYAKSFELTQGSPSANRTVKGHSATTKEFYTTPFSAKAYSAKEYAGNKAAYLGKSKVETPSAATKGKYEIPNSGTQAATKTAETKEAWDSQKKVDTRTASTAQRPFLARGRSQDQLDREKGTPESSKPLGYVGNLKTLTLEDIRELLNKNK